MSEKECTSHCYHLLSTECYSDKNIERYVCCHCGHKETKEVKLETKSWTYNEADHGPYAPKYTPMFGKVANEID